MFADEVQSRKKVRAGSPRTPPSPADESKSNRIALTGRIYAKLGLQKMGIGKWWAL